MKARSKGKAGRRPVRGYKAFGSFLGDLCCRDHVYAVGGEDVLPRPKDMQVCQWGFHFCRRLFEVFHYYSPGSHTRVCVVEATGRVLVKRRCRPVCGKCVTDKIRVVRELSHDEILGVLRREMERETSEYWKMDISHVIWRLSKTCGTDRDKAREVAQ